MWLNVREIDRNHFVFRVKAASDAYIGVVTNPEVPDEGYEVVIGGWGNSESGIRQLSNDWVTKEDTPDILSSNEWREFWLIYDAGHLEVGYGHTVGVYRFLYYHFEEPYTIRALTVCNGHGYNGEWQMNQFEGR